MLEPISPGYGFAAIIVAFVGRLAPLGILLASLLISLLYLGGESAQIHLSLPASVSGVFQGMLLFFLLATDVLIYLSVALFVAVNWFFKHSRSGLIVCAVGESPHSAHALGYSVIKVRYLTVMFGGAMAGIGGAYLSIAYTPIWAEGMTAGCGWIALALVVFASWCPTRVMMGALLFGGVTIAQFHVQGAGIEI